MKKNTFYKFRRTLISLSAKETLLFLILNMEIKLSQKYQGFIFAINMLKELAAILKILINYEPSNNLILFELILFFYIKLIFE